MEAAHLDVAVQLTDRFDDVVGLDLLPRSLLGKMIQSCHGFLINAAGGTVRLPTVRACAEEAGVDILAGLCSRLPAGIIKSCYGACFHVVLGNPEAIVGGRAVLDYVIHFTAGRCGLWQILIRSCGAGIRRDHLVLIQSFRFLLLLMLQGCGVNTILLEECSCLLVQSVPRR